MPAPIFEAVQVDGRIMVYGGTYDHREAIRTHGGKWSADDKAWYLPAGTDTSFLPKSSAPAAPAVCYSPFVLALPPADKPREEWTAAQWGAYVCAQRRARRYVVGACCTHAKSFYDYEQGPTHYHCEKHGVTKSDYAGT